MKRYEEILDDEMNDILLEKINSDEILKKFIIDSMKESAWQAWKLFTFRQRDFFERWWEEEPQTNKRLD